MFDQTPKTFDCRNLFFASQKILAYLMLKTTTQREGTQVACMTTTTRRRVSGDSCNISDSSG